MTRAELLTPLELDFLWESAGAGELPYPLQLRSHGATLDERAHLRGQVLAGLGQRGLADGRGRPEPHVENFLTCLRTRQQPNAPVEVGHHAVAGPHLANVALRRGVRARLGADGKVSTT